MNAFVRYVDVIAALALALTTVSLDVLGVASDEIVQNAVVATLAVIAVMFLRDRQRGDESIKQTHRRLDQLARGASVHMVTGSECSRILEDARRTTTRWHFKGATGTFVRAVTLPDCVAAARPHHRELDFKLEILDPNDPKLCDRYVRFHKGLPAGDGSEVDWSADGTRRELYATILAACWHKQNYEPLEIEVSLASTYSLLRYEVADSCLILTQRGPDFPATVIERDSPTYDALFSELRASRKQARPLPLHRAGDIPLSDEPTPEEIRALFAGIGTPLPDSYEDDDVIGLRVMALKGSNPYS